jgi:hypothetical protein
VLEDRICCAFIPAVDCSNPGMEIVFIHRAGLFKKLLLSVTDCGWLMPPRSG